MKDNMNDCGEDERPNPPVSDGPSRESCATILANAIKCQELKLQGLKQLQKIMVNVETGSPAEDLLWSILVHSHNRLCA